MSDISLQLAIKVAVSHEYLIILDRHSWYI